MSFSAQAADTSGAPTYSTRIVRPAADGWYPERKGSQPRAMAPVLADLSAPWPGAVRSPWPQAVPSERYEPRTGRGIPRLAGKEGWGRCALCGHTIRLRLDGLVGSHKIDGAACAGTGAAPAEPMALASWLPLCTGLTAQGLQTMPVIPGQPYRTQPRGSRFAPRPQIWGAVVREPLYENRLLAALFWGERWCLVSAHRGQVSQVIEDR